MDHDKGSGDGPLKRAFSRLADYYLGKMSESALLIKAGRLATEQNLILKTPGFPIQRAIKMVKPLARLTKRIQMGPTERKPWWCVFDNTWVWISPPHLH